MQKKNQIFIRTNKRLSSVQNGSKTVRKVRDNTQLSKPPKGSKKDAEKEVFLTWLATPAFERNPKTQKDLAKRLKVNEDTLTNWKKEKGFWDRFFKKVRSSQKEKTATLWGHFYNTMITSKGTFERAFELWLSYMENWNKMIKFSDETDLSKKITPEQRKEMSEAFLKSGLATLKEANKMIAAGSEKEDSDA